MITIRHEIIAYHVPGKVSFILLTTTRYDLL